MNERHAASVTDVKILCKVNKVRAPAGLEWWQSDIMCAGESSRFWVKMKTETNKNM